MENYDCKMNEEGIRGFLWNDTKFNLMLATWPGLYDEENEFDCVIDRKDKGEFIEGNCSTSANLYNEYGWCWFKWITYIKISYGLKLKKWWNRLFYGTFDIALVNSWINWNDFSKENLTFNEFKMKLIEELNPKKYWWLK